MDELCKLQLEGVVDVDDEVLDDHGRAVVLDVARLLDQAPAGSRVAGAVAVVEGRRILVYVESSRNCNFSCSFCSLTAEGGDYPKPTWTTSSAGQRW